MTTTPCDCRRTTAEEARCQCGHVILAHHLTEKAPRKRGEVS